MLRTSQILVTAIAVVSVSHAADYNISGQAGCEALPVAVTWAAPNECQLDQDLTLVAGDTLTVVSGIRLIIPSGQTFNNNGGFVTFNLGSNVALRGTLNNQLGGQIVDRGFWDARSGAVINNFPLSTIEVRNQLQMPQATFSNFGILHVNGGLAFLTIGNQATLTNGAGASTINDGTIRANGTFRNNSVLTNNDTIEVTGLVENNSSVTNNGDIILACTGQYNENGSFTGNPVDRPYCINGGDWSDPGAWNLNALPPSDARIFIESGVNHLDMDFSLTGTMDVTATLQIDAGYQLEILAAGSLMNNNEFITDALIINNHSLVNRGLLTNEGRIINNADFGNEGTMEANGVVENHGLFQNTSHTMQAGLDNRPGGYVDNSGIWTMNRSQNYNAGEIRNLSGGDWRLNNTLTNEFGGFIENYGMFSVNDSLTFPASLENESGGLIVNHPGGQLNTTGPAASLENAGETRNEGAIDNAAIINNPGRICGMGSITGNAVNGNAPEPVCNRPPTAVATPDGGLFECTGPTTSVSLDGRLSSDPDLRDELTYAWSPTTNLADPTAALTSGDFGLGSRNYTLTVTDLLGESDSDGASFTVQDTAAPSMTCPADITLVADDMCVGTGDPTLAQAADICDVSPSVSRSPSGNSWTLGETDVTHTGLDASGNAAQCTSVVEVVDESIPDIECNTDGVTVRPGQLVSIEATATDNCSVASVTVTGYDCWAINGAGKRVDKTGSCVVSLAGATINIIDAGGVATNVEWTVEATDGSGNLQTSSCLVTSTKPGNGRGN